MYKYCVEILLLHFHLTNSNFGLERKKCKVIVLPIEEIYLIRRCSGAAGNWDLSTLSIDLYLLTPKQEIESATQEILQTNSVRHRSHHHHLYCALRWGVEIRNFLALIDDNPNSQDGTNSQESGGDLRRSEKFIFAGGGDLRRTEYRKFYPLKKLEMFRVKIQNLLRRNQYYAVVFNKTPLIHLKIFCRWILLLWYSTVVHCR